MMKTSHLFLPNMRNVIQLLTCSDVVQISFLRILNVKSTQMNSQLNSVQQPNNSDCHLFPPLVN